MAPRRGAQPAQSNSRRLKLLLALLLLVVSPLVYVSYGFGWSSGGASPAVKQELPGQGGPQRLEFQALAQQANLQSRLGSLLAEEVTDDHEATAQDAHDALMIVEDYLLAANMSDAVRQQLAALEIQLAGGGVAIPPPDTSDSAASGRSSMTILADRRKVLLPQDLENRCEGTVGNWCGKFQLQEPLPPKAPPHGTRKCKADCNGVGVCQADFGYCLCPAGWTGEGCTTQQLRPCTNRWRTSGWQPQGAPSSLSEPGWLAGRCGGICDEEIGACFCNGTYGRIPAPEGSPPGTRALQQGRPMIEHCMPKYGEEGEENGWGNTDNQLLFDAATGWCEAAVPAHQCPCMVDNLAGDFCQQRKEAFCINQCTGHGECYLGFCHCHAGWYGADCAQRVEGQPHRPGLGETEKPWIRDLSAAPAAADPPLLQHRLRPLIYVYDLPAEYNSRLLQYRVDGGACVYRRFGWRNETDLLHTLYLVETVFHEMMLQSPHRTFDMGEADYFYVPAYTCCLLWPIYGWADHPWYHGPGGPRVMHSANMLLEVQRWIRTTFPRVWERRRGRDHIWLIPWDEGGCWAPNAIWPGIILSHWGRTDYPHDSATAYGYDNYSAAYEPDFKAWQPQDWRDDINGHPCFDPNKDLLIPAIHLPSAMHASPLYGAPPMERTILLFFRGDVGKHRLWWYSRGIRQRLYTLAREHKWRETHNIIIDDWGGEGDYSTLLATSIFCAVVPGDGFSRRAEDAILSGCLPVVICDGVVEKLAHVVDWESFSVRIAEADIERVPEILLSISAQRISEMQRSLSNVWNRFRYNNVPLYKQQLLEVMATNKAKHSEQSDQAAALLPGTFTGDPYQDDAWDTIMQWLYHRIDYTRGRLETETGKTYIIMNDMQR